MACDQATRPPTQPPPARFQGVKPPQEPSLLRPGYFDSAEGGAFLASLAPGESSQGITKHKRSRHAPGQGGEDLAASESPAPVEAPPKPRAPTVTPSARTEYLEGGVRSES